MSNMQQGRILIADDEEALREALRIFLTSRGYEVGLADNGRHALDELEKAEYDLLITDIRMPVMTGEELLTQLLDAPAESRPAIIVITAHGTIESVIKGMKVGVSAYLRKPLSMAELETAVNTAIDRRRQDRELKKYYIELDRKVEERTRELSLINRFSALVNSSLDLDHILDDAVENLTQSMSTSASWIYLMEGEPQALKLKASRGFSDNFREAASVINPADGYSGRTFRHGGAFVYDGMGEVKMPLKGAVSEEGFKTAMHAAIKSGDKVLGSMGVASKDGFQFEDSHLQLLTSFGNQVGVAVEKIRLYQQEKALAIDLQNKVNQLVILNEMGNMVKVSYRLDEAAMAIVSAIVQSTGFERVCLWLIDEKGDTLTLAACHGTDKKKAGTVMSTNGDWLSEGAFKDGEAFFATGSICDKNITGLKPEDAGRVVLAPLVTRDPQTREVSCWEVFDCTKKTCPAYNSPLACWMIKDSCVRGGQDHATLLDKLETCKLCPAYKSNRQGRSIGVLCADNETSGRAISPDDVKVLNVFANTAASVLENILLMDKLIKNERFIDSIIFNMSSGLMVTDLNGRIRMINYAGAEILRCEQTDLLGRLVDDFFPEGRRLVTVEGTSTGREVVIKTKDGPIPVGYSNSYLISNEGGSDGVIVVFRDLSDIKKLQDQLREKDRFAAIGKVAAGVAHEIRNPLFGITSVAQILAREVADGTPQKNLIDAMLSETSRLNTLVEELLLYGRPIKTVQQPTDLHTLIESVVEFHSGAIGDKEIRLVKELARDFPDLQLDPNQMRQVFLNLLMNALDASEKGGEIRIRTNVSQDRVVVKVSDNGIGIPSEDLPKVFDLFYTTKEKGTGLGLAICRKIVEDHGGSMAIKSTPAKGTTVELTFPCAKQVSG